MKAKERTVPTNSESETSEEFRNFDKGMEQILSLTPKEAERVRRKVPKPKRKIRRK